MTKMRAPLPLFGCVHKLLFYAQCMLIRSAHHMLTPPDCTLQYRLIIQFFMVAVMVACNVFNVFTMNLATTGLPLGTAHTWRDLPTNFTLAAVITCAGCILLLFLGLMYMRYKRMLMW